MIPIHSGVPSESSHFACQFVAAHMIEAGVTDGSIVNVSSTASTGALADHAAYCSSKAALDMLTKSCAAELGMHGIRVNAVNPTVTLTPMGEKAWGDPEVAAPMLHKVPLQRFARPADVASAVAFLLDGTRAAYLSGVCLPVDGGLRQAPYCHPTCAHTRRHSTGVNRRRGWWKAPRQWQFGTRPQLRGLHNVLFSCLSHLSMHTRVYSLSM